MTQKIHPIALFRLTVLGPLASRVKLKRGELQTIVRELASRAYDIPGSRQTHVSEKTVLNWYYAWKQGGIDALVPQERLDKGQSKMSPDIQSAILQAKREKPSRSIDRIKDFLERDCIVAKGTLSRSSIHRLLHRHHLSGHTKESLDQIERRAFLAEHASDIWYGDVMHGPKVMLNGQLRKVYLVSLFDDASRMMMHSEFCLGESALDIEHVLKQAVLKRGLPIKLVVDNGAAYRSGSLQGICARLEIQLIYCRPYEPAGKGKLERWHRFARAAFLEELDHSLIRDLPDLNGRLWAWLEEVYHQKPHAGLDKKITPKDRWQQDLNHIRSLGTFAHQIDEIFYHRIDRKVRKDGTVHYANQRFEVPFELVGQRICLVVDPHIKKTLFVESKEGERLGEVVLLDAIANLNRRRKRPIAIADDYKTKTRRRFNPIESVLHAREQKLGSLGAQQENDNKSNDDDNK